MDPNVDTKIPRERIAKSVTTLAILGTILLGVFALTYTLFIPSGKDLDENLDKKIQIIQYVFTALLPLWGTWMGTVLAFYFSKENFLAANESMKNFVAQLTPTEKLEATKCKDVMIPFEKIKPFPLNSTAPIEDNAADDAAEEEKAAASEVSTAENKVIEAANDLESASQTLNAALQAKSAADLNVSNAPSVVEKTEAEAEVKLKDSILNDAKVSLDVATEKVVTAKQALSGAKSKNAELKAISVKKAAEAQKAASGPIAQLANIKITDALNFMKDNSITRLPLFNGKLLQYIIHQSTFEKFITEITTNDGNTLEIGTATIGDMISYGSELIKGYLLSGAQFLDESSNLRQAQAQVEKNIYCQDIFITKKGSASEEVLGWLTNTIIAENAKDLQSKKG